MSDLHQQDLSKKRVQDMSTAERAELRRRYDAFVDHFGARPAPRAAQRKVRKWVPGERRPSPL